MLRFIIPPLISSLLFISLGLFVFSRNRGSKVNVTFFFLCLTTFVWQFSWFVLFSFPYEEIVPLLLKVGYSGIIFLPIVYYHFLMSFLNKTKETRFIIGGAYAAGIAFLALTWSGNLFIDGSYRYSWGYYPKASLVHPFYLALLAFLALHSVVLLFRGLGESHDAMKYNQTKYLLLSLVFYIPASLDFAVNYGVGYYPFGFAFILMSLFTVAYAIVRHQLLDIEVIIKKTLVFAGLFAAVYGVFAGFAFLGQVIFEHITGGNRWVSLIPSIAIIVLFFRPLERFLVNITDRYLFQKKYDYKELLKTFTSEVLTVLDLDRLLRLTVRKLTDIMKLASCGVLLLDEEKGLYRLEASLGIKDRGATLEAGATLPGFLKRANTYLSLEEHRKAANVPQRIVEDMDRLNMEMAIPLTLHADMIGILTLGKKKSDEEYTKDDMDIIMPLARTLAIAVSNARLFMELSRTQAEAAQREKMAVIGTLSAGINHEICNPLGIARGQCEAFLLNLRDGLYKNRKPEELLAKAQDIMEKVIKETDRATVITKKLSSFAKPSKGVAEDDVDIRKEIEEVLSLVEYELKLEKISLDIDIPEGLPAITADRKQLQEIFFNLIRNAAQAIAERGVISIKARAGEDRVFVDISDTGHGIPEERLGQIFNPFYTTKEPGKGTGLGLFIVKQIVERNKGKIWVRSREGEGATFTLEFPVSAKAKVESRK